MPKVDFSKSILDFDDKEIPHTNPAGESSGPLTLKIVAIEALMATLPSGPKGDPEMLTGEDKMIHADLARRIHKAGAPLTLKAEEIVLLKRRIGVAWQALAVLRANEILEGKSG